MIYISADDYGLCTDASVHIKEGIRDGALNKVSVFPNFDEIEINRIQSCGDVRPALHINLVEGRCLAKPEEVKLIVNEQGMFRYSFLGLLILSLIKKKEFLK